MENKFNWVPLVTAWWLDHLRIRENKVVAKLYEDGRFVDAVNIPTVMWPLTGAPEVFHWNNCKVIEDKEVVRIVDAIHYRIGRCYSNAEAISKALCAAGYDAKLYVGWMFVSGRLYPLHHAWTVLDGTHVVDLADDVYLQDFNADKFATATTMDEKRLLMADFHNWAQNLPHSQRCTPFGIPSPSVLYVGCESDRATGIKVYNDLMDQYPNHPCQRPKTKSGMTTLQEMILQGRNEKENEKT